MLTSDQLVSLTSRSISLSSSSYKLKHERKEIKFIGQKISVMIIFSFLLADYILCFPYHWVNHGFQYAYRRIGVHNSMPFLHESTTIISPRCATTCGTPCDYNLNVHKPSCRDDAAYTQSCLQWFTEGKCKTDVDTMRVLCPDSCGFCRRTYSFGNHLWLWSSMIFCQSSMIMTPPSLSSSSPIADVIVQCKKKLRNRFLFWDSTIVWLLTKTKKKSSDKIWTVC